VQEEVVWSTPEKTFVTGEIAEKQSAFLKSSGAVYIPSRSSVPQTHFVANISLTYKSVAAYALCVKETLPYKKQTIRPAQVAAMTTEQIRALLF
jgi:hypothetical protein